MPHRTIDEDSLIVIFGASGDLTQRKLIPALYDLWQRDQLPRRFAVLGISRTKYTDDEFRDTLHQFKPDQYADDWPDFASMLHYQPADATGSDDWPAIESRIGELQKQYDIGDRLMFYLSLSPEHFEPVIHGLGNSSLVTEGRRYCSIGPAQPWQRIVIEKPFGSDPASAKRLNDTLTGVFDEQAIYRIDHYLGKELVQNMLVLRFANTMFEPIWNRQHIDHVQITASETVGIGTRAGYYDSPAGGAMRDMVQSHLLQVLSLVAMEPPVSLAPDDVRSEKIKVFKALRVPDKADVPGIAVRGQYDQGQVDGETISAYRDSEDVDGDSQTDTYAAMMFHVDNWRFAGVPFYLRSGKAMARKVTQIVITFRPTPHCLFRDQSCDVARNQLVINVHPGEGVQVRFGGKVPGLGLKIGDVIMAFDYVKQWQATPPDGYATLLHDALRGDQTLFKHRDEIESSWQAVQPVLDHWASTRQDDLPNYAAGSWGPAAADAMLSRDGRHWHNPKEGTM